MHREGVANSGEKIPREEDVKPDSDWVVAISTRSGVVEMIAPGSYAVLCPLFIGLTVGPKCLMGLLAGAIASGCMVAIMMSSAGGAWDNSKKLCEKLKIQKTDQGKACMWETLLGTHSRIPPVHHVGTREGHVPRRHPLRRSRSTHNPFALQLRFRMWLDQ
jgi:hypothetical protein